MRAIPFGRAAAALLATFLWDQTASASETPASVLETWRTLSGHKALVRCLAFASDGRLASGGQDRLINVWSAEGNLLHSIDLRPGGG